MRKWGKKEYMGMQLSLTVIYIEEQHFYMGQDLWADRIPDLRYTASANKQIKRTTTWYTWDFMRCPWNDIRHRSIIVHRSLLNPSR